MKKLILAAALMAVASLAVAAFASAGVSRYQTQTSTLIVSAIGGAYVHTYTIKTIVATTRSAGLAERLAPLSETINGTLNGQNITINGAYLGSLNPGYTWNYNGSLSGGNASDSMGQTVPLTFTNNVTDQSNFKNHGDYVSVQGGGSDAAHS